MFGDNRLWKDRVKFLRNLATEVMAAKDAESRKWDRGDRTEIMIGWTPPRVGWMKLNTDGASHGNPGLATAGGVLRNGDGEWCGGFVFNIGR